MSMNCPSGRWPASQDSGLVVGKPGWVGSVLILGSVSTCLASAYRVTTQLCCPLGSRTLTSGPCSRSARYSSGGLNGQRRVIGKAGGFPTSGTPCELGEVCLAVVILCSFGEATG